MRGRPSFWDVESEALGLCGFLCYAPILYYALGGCDRNKSVATPWFFLLGKSLVELGLGVYHGYVMSLNLSIYRSICKLPKEKVYTYRIWTYHFELWVPSQLIKPTLANCPTAGFLHTEFEPITLVLESMSTN